MTACFASSDGRHRWERGVCRLCLDEEPGRTPDIVFRAGMHLVDDSIGRRVMRVARVRRGVAILEDGSKINRRGYRVGGANVLRWREATAATGGACPKEDGGPHKWVGCEDGREECGWCFAPRPSVVETAPMPRGGKQPGAGRKKRVEPEGPDDVASNRTVSVYTSEWRDITTAAAAEDDTPGAWMRDLAVAVARGKVRIVAVDDEKETT